MAGAPGGPAFGDGGAGPGKGGNGGAGGNGGPGGSGAGGNGGPTYALVYKGTAPTKANATMVKHGNPSAKGAGGTVQSVKAPDGALGDAADELPVQ
jgi:hypothetical protein